MQLNSRENILIAWIKWLNLRKNVLQHQSFSLASTKGTYKKISIMLHCWNSAWIGHLNLHSLNQLRSKHWQIHHLEI